VGRYCSACGASVNESVIPVPPSAHAARGIGQVFGIDPRIAFLTFVLDLMLFGVEGVSAFASVLFVSLPAGVALAYITYKAQMKWYGDDHDTALIKGCILGLLTAIPSPLPSIVYIPSGIVGLFHGIRRRLTRA
jgi:hypothetical protein